MSIPYDDGHQSPVRDVAAASVGANPDGEMELFHQLARGLYRLR